MEGLTHNGWTLFLEIETTDSNRRHEYYAKKPGEKTRHFHVSAYPGLFDMTPERFVWMVDNDFPRAPKGNWFNHEIEEAMNAS